ncbi:hypothetical protein AVEN_33516-1 [Araneus ventricosus]|uniref:Uncharacterized protein n=1 Tax=Araneus ventricosus TaxID=182803 RepID=A0A4Y2GQ85_ARAVE|nr:hypothetical protein AVEN_33516-1 [Araneus ventricosus]
MSKRYRGRYMATRLYKRSLNSSDPTKGYFYSVRQLSIGAIPAKHLATVTGSKVRQFHLSSDLSKQHHGVALSVFTSQLSLSLSSFPSSLLLKHLLSEPRGVADELFLGDSSTSWTNYPTAVVRLPSRLSLEVVNS